ncbi:transposase [Labilibaculum euxinus]|uniref:Transposase n=1 Tax=Labilibaculum euxinus TaxID=2686357 RepID=A0A7M4D7N0_9BACT|nr:transposase [Labilibaculum euxinus]MUP38659.1 transposase [Labilibaculum euxinus]MVB07864.1 transposase [Labilibaculum euxinus]
MHPNRKIIRKRNYDYTNTGWYFVTICTKNREYFFGEIRNEEMQLSVIGKQAQIFWLEIPEHFPNVELGEFVIMPDHIHGIIGIVNPRDLACKIPTSKVPADTSNKNEYMASISPKSASLSAIIRSYKSALTRWCGLNDSHSFSWLARFHERIIRNQEEYNRIEEYIHSNPKRWQDVACNVSTLKKC